MPEVKARDEAAADTKRPDAPAGIKWSFPWLGAAGSDALTSLWRISQLPANTGPKTGSAPSPVPQRVPPDAFDDIEPPSSLDRLLHAAVGRLTSGLSPAALALAYADWAMHLMSAPGKQQQLVEKAVRKTIRFGMYAARQSADPECAPCIEPLPQDRRFRGDAWQEWPFNLIYQAFLLNQQWWYNATTGITGVSHHHQQVVSFAARQLLDIFAPTNFIASNPEVLTTTIREGGQISRAAR